MNDDKGRTISVIGVPFKYVTQTLTVAATTNYTAKDVISNSASAGTYIEFADVVKDTGGSGRIVGAIVLSNSTQISFSPTLIMSTDAPTNANLNDNATNTAPHYSDTGHLGEINFYPLEYNTGGSSSELSEGEGRLPKRFICADGSRSLYAIFKTETAETAEVAGGEYTFILCIEHNS
uniref:Uncharacterized protein n=1 Tax=viral metagenome TaxID=1070528 RepID=A0A6M3L1B7_9ZZZZ